MIVRVDVNLVREDSGEGGIDGEWVKENDWLGGMFTKRLAPWKSKNTIIPTIIITE